MPAELRLLQPGEAVRTWGVLRRDEEGDWFEAPLPVPAMYSDPPKVRSRWRGAVPVVGADFESLTSRTVAGPRVEGTALVTGRWTGDTVEVLEQSTEPGPRPRSPSYREPPCPPPPGGWPLGSIHQLACSYGGLRRSGVIVASTRFRPRPTQAVLVVAANDIRAAEAQLRPQLGDRLCVVLSRCSRAEFTRAKREVSARWQIWSIYTTFGDPDDAGQPSIRVFLSRLLPEVVEWVATTPPGLVDLHPWLAPAPKAASIGAAPAPAPA